MKRGQTSIDIPGLRLHAQQLQQTSLKTAQEMVAWFGAVQGQEYMPAKWGLGLRLPHLNDTDIEQELTDGKILRTHLLRPTWHFVSAYDIHWLLRLTAPRVEAVNAYMYRQLELNTTIFNRCNKIIIKLLQGNNQLTRDEINAVFKKNKIVAQRHRLSYIMMHAELNGIICSGEKRGNQFTYALLDERIAAIKRFNKEEALAELTQRYFNSRGAATIADFTTWSGLTMADCKKGIEITKTNFEKVLIDDKEYFFVGSTSSSEEAKQKIYLLPIYDEFIMGYKDRAAILQFRNNLKPAPEFRYDSTIIFNGQVIGTWKRTIGKKKIDLEFDLFKSLTKNQKKLFDQVVNRFKEFNNPEDTE